MAVNNSRSTTSFCLRENFRKLVYAEHCGECEVCLHGRSWTHASLQMCYWRETTTLQPQQIAAHWTIAVNLTFVQKSSLHHNWNDSSSLTRSDTVLSPRVHSICTMLCPLNKATWTSSILKCVLYTVLWGPMYEQLPSTQVGRNASVVLSHWGVYFRRHLQQQTPAGVWMHLDR